MNVLVTGGTGFDIGKARHALSWVPEFTLTRGIQEMVREYLEKRK